MTTFNTGNPVGSSDPRDLYDNAENADFLINGDQPAYNDRTGVSRKSWTGVEQQVAQQATEFAADQASRETTFANFLNSSGFEYLGAYGAGVTFTEYNQYVVDAGEAWFIDPTTPLPYTTTGTGVPEGGALMSRGEAVLRQEIGSGIRRVDSLIGLQAISGRFSGDVAYMVGRTSAGDGGEGEFRWDASDLSATLVLASVTSTLVDATTDTITSAAHGLVNGNGVVTTTAVNGLTANQVYWVVGATTDTFQLSATFGGAAVDLTGTTNFTVQHLLDPLQGIYVAPTSDLTGASGAWIRAGVKDVWVEWFGAIPVAGNDNFAAISSAILMGHSMGRKIRIGGGTYEVHQSGVLSQGSGYKTGYTFEGMGYDHRDSIGQRATEIKLITGGAESWFYDNGANNEVWRFLSFSDVSFTSDDPEKAGFMRMWSAGWEQGPSFSRCRFTGFSSIFKSIGDANASETKFSLCKFNNFGAVLDLNNPQSVNHEFVSCDAEVFSGDLIRIGPAGGGSVRWFGGSIIPTGSDQIDPPTLVKAESVSSTALGSGNSDITFFGIRTEIREYSRLVKSSGNNALGVSFRRCNFAGNSGAAMRNVVAIGEGQSVIFSECSIPTYFQFEVDSDGISEVANGYIKFDSCGVTRGLPERCTLAGSSGVIESVGGRIALGTPVSGRDSYALDFFISNKASGQDKKQSLKTAEFQGVRSYGWPSGTTYQGQKLILPPGALVYSVKLYRTGAAGNGAPYQIEVKTESGDLVSQSPEIQMQNTLRHDDSGIFYRVSGASDLAGRTLLLSSAAGAEGNQIVTNGYAIVEYY